MKETQTYHIDVTDEEDALFRNDIPLDASNSKHTTKNGFAKVFCVVLGVHIVVAIGFVALSSSTANASAINEDKKIAQQVLPEATPAPTPLVTTKKEIMPTPAPKINSTKPSSNSAAKEYTIKKGDTIYSIAKKYKLNTKRLIEINDIKDVNKIQVGSTLKFM